MGPGTTSREASIYSEPGLPCFGRRAGWAEAMKTRSLILTVPVALSMLAVAPLSAEAACWVWKPCANGYDAGGAGLTESQTVLAPHPSELPPLPPDGSVRESQRVLAPYPRDGSVRPGGATAATSPAGAAVKLTPPKKPAAPKPPAAAAKPSVPAQAKAAPPPAPQPAVAHAKAVPPPAPKQPTPAKAPPQPAPQPPQAASPADTMSVPGIATVKVIPE